MHWYYIIIILLAYMELVRIRISFKSIADSYAVWAANTIMDIDIEKLSANIDAATALGEKIINDPHKLA